MSDLEPTEYPKPLEPTELARIYNPYEITSPYDKIPTPHNKKPAIVTSDSRAVRVRPAPA